MINKFFSVILVLSLASIGIACKQNIPNTSMVGVEWVNSKIDYFVIDNSPLVSKQSLQDIRKVINRYEEIVLKGGWTRLNKSAINMGLNAKGSEVAKLKYQLFLLGDLEDRFSAGETFDTHLELALLNYQRRHGLKPTKIVDQQTWNSLIIPASYRLQQLKLNYKRIKELNNRTSKNKRYVLVNIPDAKLQSVENNVKIDEFIGVVGKIDRKTPILEAKIAEIILNPTWTVPQNIVRKDLVPLVRKYPSYLIDNNITIYNIHGRKVAQELLNWNSDEPNGYIYKQDPGDNNAMATTKINFANQYEVYMHDTPDQATFVQDSLFDTSGCIRILNIQLLNKWLLKNTSGWNSEKIEKTIESKKTTIIKLQDEVRLYFTYITAWVNSNGQVNFRDDIYNRDKKEILESDER
ncbi:L,D-transpeptidase family protein [Bartonella sp. DGB1]|uniref:L,D-transpeptidase family protein n=1 Tax=Bartonella sp. DGB1 TaxID=3239807 RepID=UPI0035239900